MIFIRPWLLLLIFIPLLFYFWQRQQVQKSPWTKWVDKKLLPFLLMQTDAHHKKVWQPLLWGLWSLLIIAASGPAFEKLPVPTSNALPNTVVLFDLSPSMQGSALASAKIKMHDLLTALKGNRVALVLYDNQGYTALPFTQDRALLRNLISSLDASVLPGQGWQLSEGFKEANRLIQQVGGKGRIIYLTAGGVNARDVETPYPVGVLGVGDDAAISKSIKNLGTYRFRSADASDILTLLKATEPELSVVFNTDVQADVWADLAGIMVLILLPFILLTFRRGVLFAFMLMFMVSAEASFFAGPAQRKYEAEMQAVQAYRDGDYNSAVKGFQNSPYNLGNALAHAGQIQQAIGAYQKALELDPNDEDARFNKEYLEKQLPPQEQQNQNKEQENKDKEEQDQTKSDQNNQNQGDNSDDNSDQEDNQSESSEMNQQEQSDQNQKDEEQSAAASEEEKDSSEEKQETEQQSTDTEEQENSNEVNEADREESPFDQGQQQLLNRVKSDPYRVLRYRLNQQKMRKR